MNINNASVSNYYNYLITKYCNRNLSEQDRIIAKSKMDVIQDLVGIYEHGYEEDLFLNEMGRPALPEEIKAAIRKFN
ncbi:hypothetical protein [Brevibacillus laterosporus]|uniref:hypothetical protein n=1 Tax=Brevibacillus laterosporus TaxID=1465 RepID=UPI000E6C2DDF|nr:hypothetical protein [Brevibacillus laterosporus]AYB37676.1 hypothetical protein D5F52_04905 [Brevibacillus laterosporus]MBM7111561.1 hypothetical protein [Brevibacillus laterosporus]